jgi:hypothetical protein
MCITPKNTITAKQLLTSYPPMWITYDVDKDLAREGVAVDNVDISL